MTHHRDLRTIELLGEPVDFIASNERLRERVDNISHETYIIETLVDRLDSDEVFWDVGACLGIHTLTVAPHLEDGKVIGFEPMPANRGVLTDNLHANGFDNTEVAREALSDELGTAEFAIRESFQAGYGRHSLDVGEYEKLKTIEVPVARGDSLIGSRYPIPNAVKIDVEGAGPLVLQGMEHILRRDECHTVILETHEPNDVQPSHEDFGFTTDDIIELLESFGFTVREMENFFHLEATKDTTQSKPQQTEFEVVQGDIAEQSADAIVNAAGTSLRMGSGVAGSLREKAGEEINQEAVRNGPTPLGSAVVTDAYDLDADIVIHAAAMPHYGDGKATVESIRSSVRYSLQLAEDNGCSTVALPAVGCGLAGVPLHKGAKVIRDEVDSFAGDSVESVRLVAYTPEELGEISMAVNI